MWFICPFILRGRPMLRKSALTLLLCVLGATAANAQVDVDSQQRISSGSTGRLDDGDVFGRSVTSLGDLDGDGVPEMAVGAPGADEGGPDRGTVWVAFLSNDGTVKRRRKISATEGPFGEGLDDGDLFGRSVASLGDLDDDSITVVTIAIGAPGDDAGGA